MATPADFKNKDAIRKWLYDYIWQPSSFETRSAMEYKNSILDCIFSQDNWQYLDARVERLMGMRSGENSVEDDMSEAIGLELSSLYECHDEPHLDTCPFKRF
jgi:hypothetical protein